MRSTSALVVALVVAFVATPAAAQGCSNSPCENDVEVTANVAGGLIVSFDLQTQELALSLGSPAERQLGTITVESYEPWQARGASALTPVFLADSQDVRQMELRTADGWACRNPDPPEEFIYVGQRGTMCDPDIDDGMPETHVDWVVKLAEPMGFRFGATGAFEQLATATGEPGTATLEAHVSQESIATDDVSDMFAGATVDYRLRTRWEVTG